MMNNITDYVLDAKLIHLQFGDKMAVLSQILFVPSANELYSRIFYICSPSKKQENFEFFTLKISCQVRNVGFKNGKCTHMVAKKMSHHAPQSEVLCDLQSWLKPHEETDTVHDLNALAAYLLTNQRRLVFYMSNIEYSDTSLARKQKKNLRKK